MLNIFKRFRVIILVFSAFVISLVAIFLVHRSSKVYAEYTCVSGVNEFNSMAKQAKDSSIRCSGPGDGCFGSYFLTDNHLLPNRSNLGATCEGFTGPFVKVKIDNNGKIMSVNSA